MHISSQLLIGIFKNAAALRPFGSKNWSGSERQLPETCQVDMGRGIVWFHHDYLLHCFVWAKNEWIFFPIVDNSRWWLLLWVTVLFGAINVLIGCLEKDVDLVRGSELLRNSTKFLGSKIFTLMGRKWPFFGPKLFFGCLLRSQWILILSSGSFPNGWCLWTQMNSKKWRHPKKWQGGRLEEFPLRRTIFLKTICVTLFKIKQSVFRVKTLAPTSAFRFCLCPL